MIKIKNNQGYVLPIILVLSLLISSVLAYDMQTFVRTQRLHHISQMKQDLLAAMKISLHQYAQAHLDQFASDEVAQTDYILDAGSDSKAQISILYEPCNGYDICFQQPEMTQYRITIQGQWLQYQGKSESLSWQRYVLVDFVDEQFVLRGFFQHEI